jgi:tRNA nucleotidyltransferase (CCA-adding enzyme)
MKAKHSLPLTITEKLNFQALPGWLDAIAARLGQHGFQAYLVGGAVRDLLCGTPPHDWDLATNALPDEVETLFPGAIPTGKQYGTITVLAGNNTVEVTTFREDLEYRDGRRPSVIRFSQNIAADLARRDFTVNAIAYNFASGRLTDPFDGRNDLRRRVLKAVGNPAIRFQEDGLRMLRFYRFIATLDFKPDRATAKAIDPTWIRPVSPERIGTELTKSLTRRNWRPAILEKKNYGGISCKQLRLSSPNPNYAGPLYYTISPNRSPKAMNPTTSTFTDTLKPGAG